MRSRTRTFLLTLSAVAIIGCTALTASLSGEPGPDVVKAAQALTASFDTAQTKTAVLPFDTEQRVGWHFIPKKERKGLQIKHMKPEQQKLALGLLRACLSAVGYEKATTIMSLEQILHKVETEAGKNNWTRDSQRYYYTFFGNPGPSGRWGLSIEGHHMSLNFVIDDSKVVAHTPEFFGTNPGTLMADYGIGPKKGTQVLEKEITLAFKLVNSLDADQAKVAVIAAEAPKEIRAAGETQAPAEPAAGLAAAKMNDAQKNTLRQLIETYAHNMPAATAQQCLDDLDAAGFDKIKLAWAGAKKSGEGHYFRVEGPTFLIEYCNVQPDAAGIPANHPHSVWRDMRGDFGIHR